MPDCILDLFAPDLLRAGTLIETHQLQFGEFGEFYEHSDQVCPSLTSLDSEPFSSRTVLVRICGKQKSQNVYWPVSLISKKDWIELLLFYKLCQHNNLGGHIGRTSVLIRARKNCKSPKYTW